MSSVTLDTTMGRIEIELYHNEAPLSCRNFHTLASRGYFSSCLFHRVVPDLLIQSGDPSSLGTSGASIYDGGICPDEISGLKHTGAGVVGMANSGPNTAGSQFYITLAPAPWLDGKSTVFGRVSRGMEVVKRIGMVQTRGERPVVDVRIREALAE